MPGCPGPSIQPFAMFVTSLIPRLFASDSALAEAAGVHRSTVLRWKRGTRPEPDALPALAMATGVELRTLRRIAGYPAGGER